MYVVQHDYEQPPHRSSPQVARKDNHEQIAGGIFVAVLLIIPWCLFVGVILASLR